MLKSHDYTDSGAAPVRRGRPWYWVPTLYFAEGLPYMAVMTVTTIMYTQMGIDNTTMAFYTSWLYLPWVIKPFWSPFVDIIRTKRWWVVTMQAVIAVGMAMIAFAIPAATFFQLTLAVFWLIAFASATHDIAADGFYMLGLTEHEQSFFVGIRSLFYRFSMIAGQGGLVVLAGHINSTQQSDTRGWIWIFAIMSAFFLLVSCYHHFILPRPKSDSSHMPKNGMQVLREFCDTFVDFFRKPGVVAALLFMLLYRLPEALLVKMINPFLLAPAAAGGMDLSTESVGMVYGTVGVIGLMVGGILGGIVASVNGLKRWLHPMAWSMSLTCLTFVYLAWASPQAIWQVYLCVFVEQFGYGFGFTAYMLYLIYFSAGRYKTAHYSICTGFMALGMMLPGMAAGWLTDTLGYLNFFLLTIGCCICTIGVCYLVKVSPEFGRKIKENNA